MTTIKNKYASITNLYYLFSFMILSISSCKKYDKGFLSPYIRYQQETFVLSKGRDAKTTALIPDYSSTPLSIRWVHVYNGSGQVVDELFTKKYPIQVWTKLYDPVLDITLEQINKKRGVIELPAISINEVSGVIEGNAATSNLPSGKYTFDIEVSNAGGKRLFPKLVNVILEDAPSFEANPELGNPLNVAIKYLSETTTMGQPSPIETVTKVASSPNIIILKFVDKNNNLFNPQKMQVRPNAGIDPQPPVRPQLGDRIASVVKTTTAFEITYAILPFPLQETQYGFRCYYRIPYDHIKIDNVPDDFSANPSLLFRAWAAGKYEITIKLPNAVVE